MSTTIHDAIVKCASVKAVDPEYRRAYAVATALEIIAAKASGADASNLGNEFNRLSEYADKIQAALAKVE